MIVHHNINLGLEVAPRLKAYFTLIVHNHPGDFKIKTFKGHKFDFLGTGNNFLKNYNPAKINKIELSPDEYQNCLKILTRYQYRYEKLLITRSQKNKFIDLILDYSVNLIASNSINLVILPEIPHQKLDYFIFLAAKTLKIRQLFISGLPIVDLNNIPIFISDKYGSFGSLFNHQFDKTNSLRLSPDNPLYPYYLAYKGADNKQFKQVIATINHPDYITRIKAMTFRILAYLKYNGIGSFLSKVLISLLGYVNLLVHRFFYSPSVLRFYKKKSAKIISTDNRFIYLPLHFQPEATTVPAGNEYSDQIKIILALIQCLPSNINIYIKEHPAYLADKSVPISLSRSKKFYKRILAIKQCKLIDINYDTYDLIKYSFSVATVTGTVAFEALANNKPCINFGDSKYNEFPNSIVLKNLKNESLENRIIDISKNLSESVFIDVLNNLSKLILVVSQTNQGYTNSLLFEEKKNATIIDNLSKYSKYID